ncbi:methylenetetrahydrofolate reductase [Pseudomonas zhanjiangensis]|uniref:Methylenetetrahydrofolate reductase n=1 Tax=Pseudomonas zhanjiangensis TaxID=3239015 RepID=A0ABV3YYZ9_9PSED
MASESISFAPSAPHAVAEGYASTSQLEHALRQGHFAVTTELAPPDSARAEDVYERVRVFDGVVDGVNATDGSGARCHMSSLAVCALLSRLGYSPVMQISCRDRNRIAIQGDVLGAAAMGVSNIMCLSGDGVQVGDHPGAKPVFDLDSMSALEIIRGMRDDARFQSGRLLSSPPEVFMGAAANPFVPDHEFRVTRLAKKIAAGAQFVQTQYCFDIPLLEEYMKQVRDRGLDQKIFILVGVGPLPSARGAEFIRSKVPGVHIPDAIIKRLTGAENQKEEGKKICIEMMQQIKEIKGISGVHVMAFRMEETVVEMVQAAGVLGKREPWYPGSVQASR